MIEIDSRNSTKHEEMYATAVEGPPRCAAGEVIPEVAMFTAEEAPACLIWNDIETERDGIFFCMSPNGVKFLQNITVS